MAQAGTGERIETSQDGSGRSGVRPRTTGDPLDLSSNPSVPKPAVVVEVFESEATLRLEDRKLYNVLLALSWERLSNPDDHGPFVAPALALRRAIGQRTEKSNGRLRESLDRLRMTTVRFPRLMNDGTIGETATSLLSSRTLPFNGSSVEWNFDQTLRPHFADPKVWTRINLRTCAGFRSKYSLILYELLCLRAGLRRPVWSVEIDELRKLSATTHKFKDYNSFEKRVLLPAVSEINECAHFNVEYEAINKRYARKVERICFTFGEGAAAKPGIQVEVARQGNLFDGTGGRPLAAALAGRPRSTRMIRP